MSSGFSGKVVVITGGSGVLGRAMAQALALKGARVAILGTRKDKAERIAADISKQGGQAIGLACNVLEKESLEMARQQVLGSFGPCDILINGAGGNHPDGTTSKSTLIPGDMDVEGLKTFFSLDPEGIRFVFDLNFMGTLLTCQVFGRDMVGRDGANIINISSMNAFRPLTKIPAYSGAKAAVSNFTQWLAVHFAKAGIRVNAIAPGFFLTEQNQALLTQPDGTLTERGNAIIAHTPAGRFGSPDDLTGALLWLAGNGAAFVTGTIIPVDGGFSAYSGV